MLEQGVEVWNRWRKKHPILRPDFEEAVLKGADLQGAGTPKSGLRFLVMELSGGKPLPDDSLGFLLEFDSGHTSADEPGQYELPELLGEARGIRGKLLEPCGKASGRLRGRFLRLLVQASVNQPTTLVDQMVEPPPQITGRRPRVCFQARAQPSERLTLRIFQEMRDVSARIGGLEAKGQSEVDDEEPFELLGTPQSLTDPRQSVVSDGVSHPSRRSSVRRNREPRRVLAPHTLGEVVHRPGLVVLRVWVAHRLYARGVLPPAH